MSGRLIIAGTASNVGKTALTVGLIAAFRQRGLTVQPFKAGPDYIDPTYHTLAAGQPSRNLDSWLLPHARLRAMFAHATRGADLALIEGVMGLYDGLDYTGEAGSTAELAKLLHVPIILVLDVWAQARSAAATARGFQMLDPAVPLAGFLCNRVGSASHYAGVKAAIEDATGLPVLGGIPRTEALVIPERHLGLVPTDEREDSAMAVEGFADTVRSTCDLDAIWQIAQTASVDRGERQPARSPAPALIMEQPAQRPVIAVARDRAFSFYYEDNLDLLRHFGADVRLFSPLRDDALPPGTRALYIGGGFPEIYAGQLAANAAMRSVLHSAITGGMPCYAECGGLMYLTQALVDQAGARHDMVGALPGYAVMQAKRLQIGYTQVRAARDTLLLKSGEEVRGHEFHYSIWEGVPPDLPHAYMLQGRSGETSRPEGFADGNVLASYVHLHFWSNPDLARRFVTHTHNVCEVPLMSVSSADRVRIREATPSDAAAIARVHIDTWRSAYGGIVSADYLAHLSDAESEGVWRGILADAVSSRCLIVAAHDTGVVGFVLGGPRRMGPRQYTGELQGIYILAAFQRRGIGRQLTLAVARRLLALGNTMIVWVLADNGTARHFYETLGGQPVATDQVEIGGTSLSYLAYGWSDLRQLVGALEAD